jgi:Protein of unknown function (DUF1460)
MYLKLFSLLLFFVLGFKSDTDFQTIFLKINGKARPEIIINTAQLMLGKPYVAHTLEVNESESLVCNFEGLDCATLVENVTALMMTRYQKQNQFADFKANLTALRYQNGKIDGYGSRIHYFSDWLVRNEKKAGFKNISSTLGGELMTKKIVFMTKNAKLYAQLSNQITLKKINEAEQVLNQQKIHFIPKLKVSTILNQIKTGDIIAFTSTVEGLDVNHEGFAFVKDGQVYLLHASLEKKKVVVSDETLVQYLTRIKKHSGIIVARFS